MFAAFDQADCVYVLLSTLTSRPAWLSPVCPERFVLSAILLHLRQYLILVYVVATLRAGLPSVFMDQLFYLVLLSADLFRLGYSTVR